MRAAVRVTIGIGDGVFYCFNRFWRWADGIFVGGQLDGVNFQFALDFFDGTSGNVSGEAANVVRNQICDGVCHYALVFSELRAFCAFGGELLFLLFGGAVKMRRNCMTSFSFSVR